MSEQPVRSELCGGVLYVTLDTPGSVVNVFTRDAAASLCDILREIIPQNVRAVVLRSAKPHSFLNGVGLMLAGALKTVDDASQLIRPVREAYEALRNCPVPTIAAIEGNCYGCGVELALQCAYRIVSDSFESHFYMTELSDYLFIPTFGGTQDLPRLLGLEKAAEFVLWGRRLSAHDALAFGLVDRCVEARTFGQEVNRFAERVASESGSLAARLPLPAVDLESDKRVVRSNLQRIERLPPAYREVYTVCLELMAEAAAKPHATPDDYVREARASARSVLAPPCRAAWPFFFLRQMARALATSDSTDTEPNAAAFETDDVELTELCETISSRCVRAAERETAPDAHARRLSLRRYDPRAATPPSHLTPWRVLVADSLSGKPLDPQCGVILHTPVRALGIEVAEIASGGGRPSETETLLAWVLSHAHYTVLRTRPKRFFVTEELIVAWLAPQLAYLDSGGTSGDLACSFRMFGFTRLSGDWIDLLGQRALTDFLRAHLPQSKASAAAIAALPTTSTRDGRYDAAIVSAMLVSLAGFAARMLRDGCVSHASFLDVAARDIIDFPLIHTSLCRHMTLRRGRELLQSKDTFCHLVTGDDLMSLEEYVRNGRPYYLGFGSPG